MLTGIDPSRPGIWVGAEDLRRDLSLAHLAAHVARLGRLVSGVVAERRAADPNPDDPYRGLYVSDSEVDQLLRKGIDRVVRSAGEAATLTPDDTRDIDIESVHEQASSLGQRLRLVDLADAFALDPLDVDLLVIALSPDLDPRFEKLFGYLHDDVTRKRPSIGLSLELLGRGFGDADARGRFAVDSRLAGSGLVVVDDADRPFLTRAVRVPDRVLSHLLGDTRIDPVLSRLQIPAVALPLPEVDQLARALAEGLSPVYVHDNQTGVGMALGASALLRTGRDALVLDLSRLYREDDALAVARVALREARLRQCGLVVGCSDEVIEEHPGAMHALAALQWPAVLVGGHPWDPQWSQGAPFVVRATRPEASVSLDLWRACLDGAVEASGASLTVRADRLEPSTHDASDAPDVGITVQFRLRPDQIVRAAATARVRAVADHREIDTDDLRLGARSQNSSKLERLARRIEPAVEWDDLVLPPEVMVQLRDLAARYRNRGMVYGDWLMGGKNNRRLGVAALFAGPSGVGKTMAAEALAAALGLDLYTINLATVVDKYIGETEKNLERIFVAAEGVNGVIFFDEADALFGKRSEVNDARDRYANVEVAYLLQRLEVFEGVGILASNLRTNIDEAFTRRLDALIDFPEPEEEYRLRLWDRCLGSRVPRADDVDLAFLAKRFKLSGGNIRNVAVSAAFQAAEEDQPVNMSHLVVGTAREYRKLGRLCTEHEFGPFFKLVTGSA